MPAVQAGIPSGIKAADSIFRVLQEKLDGRSYGKILSEIKKTGAVTLSAIQDRHCPTSLAHRLSSHKPFGRVLLHLLNRGEQPLPIPVSHEGPDFGGFSRFFVTALDEITRFSALFR